MGKEIKQQAAECRAKFRSYSVKAMTDIEKALNIVLLAIERDAKRNYNGIVGFKSKDDESVNGEPPRVQTGRLRASITHRIERDGDLLHGSVGTNVDYAAELELGTGRKWKHPFLQPALDMHESEIDKRIQEALKEAERSVAK